ncbi:MAG: alpha/beta hydrolase [Lysobacter sp.]
MIHRQFVRLGTRHVHFRHAGSGPALLLLHQSPQNSRMWLGMIERFSDRYTVVAPDTPGFGYSDLLASAQPSIAELAEATIELADALGMRRFAVFGMHTGGLIAAQLASAHPDRVAALVVDGYAAFTAAESAIYGERYLPPFEPQWDGSHLRWLWSRMREQKYFFPWYDGRAECAMAIDPHSTGSTHEAVMDVLEVGDGYRAGYGAAFRHVEHGFLTGLKPPSLLVYRCEDPLLAHLPRLPALPAHVQAVLEEGGIVGLHGRMDAVLAETLADAPPLVLTPAATAVAVGTQRAGGDGHVGWVRRIVACAVGDIGCWTRAGSGELHVHLHAPGARPLRPDEIAAGEVAVVAPELPGHGASSEVEAELGTDTMLAAILAVLATASSELPVVIECHGAAAGYIPELAERLGPRLQRVVLHQPWLLDAAEAATLLEQLPDPQPRRAGGHLDEAWQWERERHLLWPWLPPSAAARRKVAAPTPAQVNHNVVELLRLGARCKAMFRDAAPAGLAARLHALTAPITLAVPAGGDDGRGPLAAQHDDPHDYQGRAAALLTPPVAT